MRGDVTVVVTWMDGMEKTYEGFDVHVTNGNNLVISQRLFSEKPTLVIPLDNVRIYAVKK